jgi:hypothetical protein
MVKMTPRRLITRSVLVIVVISVDGPIAVIARDSPAPLMINPGAIAVPGHSQAPELVGASCHMSGTCHRHRHSYWQ